MKKTIPYLVTALAVVCLIPAAQADSYPIKKCVVTGDAFGGDLGDPIDITYKGRLVRLCCKSCVKKFNKDPEKYIAALDKLTGMAKK